MQRYVVVGGGISGLAAAWELTERVPGAAVTVLEGSPLLGGKLRVGEVAGLEVDVGAESLLARRPEAVRLVEEAGLGDDLVHPATTTASIWSRGRLHPMPRRTLMGVPAEPRTLRGLLEEAEVARAEAETVPPADGSDDLSVGDLVASHLGDAVVDRLVEPLLGGVYAGHARSISAAAALPALLEAHRSGQALVTTVAGMLAASDRAATPLFAGVRGGLHRLPAALAATLRRRGVTIRTGTLVRELRPLGDPVGWELVTGPVPVPTAYLADRVVLAVPAAPAARLLGGPAPRAAAAMARVESASMAVVTVALPALSLPRLPGSGLLVPPVEGRQIKAATFSAAKWAWVGEAGLGAGQGGQDLVLLRASLGRHREESALQRPDEELVGLVLADLADALDAPLPAAVDSRVDRWGGGLPQYAVGHRAAMATVAEDVAGVPGLEVCGAAYDGVGIPACIASGRAAAARLVAGTPTSAPVAEPRTMGP